MVGWLCGAFTWFQLEDFEAVLQHYDDKLAARLNHNYMVQEWKFSREKHGSKRLPKDVPPVDSQVRIKQVSLTPGHPSCRPSSPHQAG